jgi:glycosyltransferase involved in cell wall biosynthesis
VKIGIDVSQTAYKGTGVSGFVTGLVKDLAKIDKKNQYVLFYSSLRSKLKPEILSLRLSNIKIKTYLFPPSFLDLLWNKMHIFPIEWLIGNVDVFITSDWTEPPAMKAKKVTILYDMIVYKYPKETAKRIIEVQKRKLKWVKKESKMIFCISNSTKKDAAEILGIESKRLKVIYPGI